MLDWEVFPMDDNLDDDASSQEHFPSTIFIMDSTRNNDIYFNTFIMFSHAGSIIPNFFTNYM